MRGLLKGTTAVGVLAAALATSASATHSWGSYHWARTSNPISVQTGDNVTSVWDAYLVEAIADWNKSSVIDSYKVAGSTNPRNCRGVSGTIQVCNSTYGNNGWLGLASISVSGNHITAGTTKLNDTYFNTARYNTPAWRRLVMCQEIGHDYGLDHQDEAFDNANLGTCQDYTNDPDGPPSNEHPNAHDYEQLEIIYGGHTDSTTTVAFRTNGAGTFADIGDTPATWGKPVRFDRFGRPNVFVRIDGPNQKTITHVTWAIGEGPRR